MNFVTALIKNAKAWLDCKEDPGRPNRSVCVDKVHKVFGHSEPWSWCAEFVWMITDQTCKMLGIENKLPKTASTQQMIRDAPSKGLRVDKKPIPGSVMFYPTGSATGHVGFVVSVNGNKIKTVEGNTSDAVRVRTHTLKDKYRFIHIEDTGVQETGIIAKTTKSISKAKINKTMVLLTAAAILAGGAAWYISRK